MAAWDDPTIDWSRYAFAVIRSSWNYYEDPIAFRKWVEDASIQTRLHNSAKVVLANLDKRYLGTLEASGIPIVPTRLLANDSDLQLVLEETGWTDYVIKPTISAGSFMTKRFSATETDLARKLVAEILESRRAMIQPYMNSVEAGGEVSLIHIDGELTHAITKQPRFEGNDEEVSQAFLPNQALRAAAARVLNAIEEPWLYARVDLMQDQAGDWLLSELELVEPSLFFAQCPEALAKFVSALSKIDQLRPKVSV
jgi:glutathione synthase/RimK-type ligase-like ATP-grasp enzyme